MVRQSDCAVNSHTVNGDATVKVVLYMNATSPSHCWHTENMFLFGFN